MATTQATKDYNTFVRGIITEANALTYPENASIDEENFVLNKDGSRQRRLGMDFEADYTLSANIPVAVFKDQAIQYMSGVMLITLDYITLQSFN